MTSIASRVAMITGAGNGIGRGTAIAFAQRGAKLVLVDIDAEGLAETAAQVEAAGAEVLPITIDIAREDAFVSVRDQVATRFGTVDIVMNNVGVIIGGRFHEIPLTEWERIINLNLMSVIRAIHLFLPDLLAKGVGHIVNTASFAGLFPYAYDRLPYAAAKGGLVTMTEGLALYLKPLGIGVTLLCPGASQDADRPVVAQLQHRRAAARTGDAVRFYGGGGRRRAGGAGSGGKSLLSAHRRKGAADHGGAGGGPGGIFAGADCRDGLTGGQSRFSGLHWDGRSGLALLVPSLFQRRGIWCLDQCVLGVTVTMAVVVTSPTSFRAHSERSAP